MKIQHHFITFTSFVAVALAIQEHLFVAHDFLAELRLLTYGVSDVLISLGMLCYCTNLFMGAHCHQHSYEDFLHHAFLADITTNPATRRWNQPVCSSLACFATAPTCSCIRHGAHCQQPSYEDFLRDAFLADTTINPAARRWNRSASDSLNQDTGFDDEGLLNTSCCFSTRMIAADTTADSEAIE